ncbi:aquaporin [Pediococcus inopinatus]|uniref:MIP/aquaporin family protein n=1 Tax=Pediococcus inopinatus TaxID=114090 RepID=UPI002B2581EB|nr:aquaporin [Pediococcus inopinatus]WPC18353.1 aquaporin [Pediococcus inopinatus]
MRKYVAEIIGTFVLVFVGTGTVVIAKGSTLTIGLAFGLAVTIMAYSVGAISGGHFNPAVSLGMLLNKRISGKDFIGYVISQFIGAILASAMVFDLVHELGLSTKGLGQTDFPNISVGGAFITETLVTFLFVLVILLVTSKKWGNPNFAGLVIGLTLGLMIIVALNLTGGSLNPARSFGPALFAGGSAMAHYWLYLTAPLVGAVLAAGVSQFLGSEE